MRMNSFVFFIVHMENLPADLRDSKDQPNSQLKDSLKAKRRTLKSGVGTPDYVAPEIFLGTGHCNEKRTERNIY